MEIKFTEMEKIMIEDALRCYYNERANIGESFNGLKFLQDVSEKIIEKVNENMDKENK